LTFRVALLVTWHGRAYRRNKRRLRWRVPRTEDLMGLEYVIMGIVSLLVGIYLVVALLRPDVF
jgi:K+-transporting ATPase KdpF subunit